jgi:hypothetical protein
MTSRFFVFGLFTTLGVVAWSGCGPGSETRYYCDDLGCYTCDAYGCSDVAAPAPKTCSGNSSCGPGEICTSTGCLKTCTDDASCGDKSGLVCKNGYCSSPTQKDPPKTVECTTKADCGGDGKACVDSKCVACGGTAGPCPCTASTDCSGGLTCVAGKCTAPSNVCKYSSDCADGKVCADGQCLTSCASAPCSDGFTCTKGVCQPNATGGGGGQTQACSNDDVCGAGKFCDQGQCVVDTRPQAPNCANDTQCTGTPARKCVGGYCKYTCTDSNYCLTIDSRIGVCAKDGVCRTPQEANASCVDPSGCSGGQSCIDNQCK